MTNGIKYYNIRFCTKLVNEIIIINRSRSRVSKFLSFSPRTAGFFFFVATPTDFSKCSLLFVHNNNVIAPNPRVYGLSRRMYYGRAAFDYGVPSRLRERDGRRKRSYRRRLYRVCRKVPTSFGRGGRATRACECYVLYTRV